MTWWGRLKFYMTGFDDRPLDDILAEKAVKAGLDPVGFLSWLDEIRNLPPEPGSLGPGDPGAIGRGKGKR